MARFFFFKKTNGITMGYFIRILVALTLLGGACLSNAQNAAQRSPAGAGGISALGSEASSSYVIQPLDYLRFRVIGEPETLVEVRVSAEGSVSLPYVGTVGLDGLTVSEAQRRVFDLYNGDYYVNPQIDLTIIAYSGRAVEVLGHVGKQGSVGFPSEKPLYLLEAISRAGGFLELGNRKAVEIRRVRDGKDAETIVVDTTSISPRDFPLRDGDIINVPRRVW